MRHWMVYRIIEARKRDVFGMYGYSLRLYETYWPDEVYAFLLHGDVEYNKIWGAD